MLNREENSNKIQIFFILDMDSWLDVIVISLKLSSVPHLQANDSIYIWFAFHGCWYSICYIKTLLKSSNFMVCF